MLNLVVLGSTSFLSRKAACSYCRPLHFLRYFSSSRSNLTKNSTNDKQNHYEILGIEKDASFEDIRSAFLRLSKDYHPDINSKDPLNHEKFVDINEAYSVLSKPLLRREYDNELLYRLKGYGQNASSRYTSTANYQESPYYDPQFYANRDKSQDAYYAGKPFYGVRGISNVSNQSIVYICMSVILIGAAFHFFVVKKLSDIHIENLNERDSKIHKMWVNAIDSDNKSALRSLIKIKVEEDKEERNRGKDV